MKRAAIYARVSTLNGQDPGLQTRELKEYCKRKGWKITAEYVDKGISGTTDSRPRLDQLMKDAHRGLVDIVVCWKFDRFGRSVSHLLRALETFKSLGIEFSSLGEQFDTSTPTGKMVLTMLGALAEMEQSFIVDRVKAGMRNAKARGIRIGRPRKKTFSAAEIEQICIARRKERASVRGLSLRFGGTQFMVKQVLEQNNVAS